MLVEDQVIFIGVGHHIVLGDPLAWGRMGPSIM